MKRNTLTNFLMFTAGAAIGSVVTWVLVKTKYEQMAQAEVEEMREYYRKKKDDGNIPLEQLEELKETLDDYKAVLNNNGYTNIEEGEEIMADKPYVISPDDFGELDDYEANTLFYYADGVLTDDFDNPIEDVERIVGLGFETHFGEYEDDSVFIRNDALKSDYEILLDTRNFYDVHPRTMEG